MKSIANEIALIDRVAEAAARGRQARLTKPAGALGRLVVVVTAGIPVVVKGER